LLGRLQKQTTRLTTYYVRINADEVVLALLGCIGILLTQEPPLDGASNGGVASAIHLGCDLRRPDLVPVRGGGPSRFALLAGERRAPHTVPVESPHGPSARSHRTQGIRGHGHEADRTRPTASVGKPDGLS